MSKTQTIKPTLDGYAVTLIPSHFFSNSIFQKKLAAAFKVVDPNDEKVFFKDGSEFLEDLKREVMQAV
jgi:hypothetical protein